MTRLGNIGAILCLIASTKFLDSGETEMREEFVCSQAVTYESAEEAIREPQLEEGELIRWIISADGLRRRYYSFQNIV